MSEPTIRYASVCSGVESASLAWIPLGWEAVFFSEVEPFPCAVLHHRFGAGRPIHPLDPAEIVISDEEWKIIGECKKENPKTWRKIIESDLLGRYDEFTKRENWIKQNNELPETGMIPNEGDFTKIGDKYRGKMDLLVGGTPCQSFSVAGKRAGLAEVSGLALDFIRLAYESQVKWIVWENVPGCFSTNGGRDFGVFLSGLSGIEIATPGDGWRTAGFVRNHRSDRFGLAWRVLDAQFTRVPGFPFAIPQRRRRVFVVGYFGDWERAAAVLLEPDRLSWDTPPRRIKGAGVARSLTASTGGASGKEQQLDFVGGNGRPLNAIESGHGFYSESDVAQTLEAQEDQHRRNILCMATGQGGAETSEDCAVNLTCNHESPLICAGFCQGASPAAGSIGYHEQVSPTIKAGESGTAQVPALLCVHGSQDPIVNPDHAKAGTGGGNLPLVQAIAIAENVIGRRVENGGNGVGAKEDVAYTQNCTGVMGVCQNATVRRLLPVECERLMGFPDNHTRIPWKGKPEEQCPDAPRYKACGNSMCVNVMRWLGERIDAVEKSIQAGTFDQLFDADDLELEGDETEMDEDAEAEYMVILEDQAKEILRLKQENEQLRHTVAAYQQKESAK